MEVFKIFKKYMDEVASIHERVVFSSTAIAILLQRPNSAGDIDAIFKEFHTDFDYGIDYFPGVIDPEKPGPPRVFFTANGTITLLQRIAEIHHWAEAMIILQIINDNQEVCIAATLKNQRVAADCLHDMLKARKELSRKMNQLILSNSNN